MNAYIENLPTAPLLKELSQRAPAKRSPFLPGAVLDTNVLMDIWVFENPAGLRIFEFIRAHRTEALASPETLEELADVLSRPAFSLPHERQQEILQEWGSLCTLCPAPPPSAQLRTRDRDDQKFLDLALSAQAQYLVSRDKHLLKCAGRLRKHGIEILTPEAFLERMADQSPVGQ